MRRSLILAGLVSSTLMLCSTLFAPVALAGKPDRLRLGPFEPIVIRRGLYARRRSRLRASAPPTSEGARF